MMEDLWCAATLGFLFFLFELPKGIVRIDFDFNGDGEVFWYSVFSEEL